MHGIHFARMILLKVPNHCWCATLAFPNGALSYAQQSSHQRKVNGKDKAEEEDQEDAKRLHT